MDLCSKFGTLKFSPRHVDRRKCCQLSLTDERQQLIAQIIQLCLQRDGRDTARCAGPSVFPWFRALIIDRVAGEIIRLVASVCVCVCVRPFICGRSPV